MQEPEENQVLSNKAIPLLVVFSTILDNIRTVFSSNTLTSLCTYYTMDPWLSGPHLSGTLIIRN